VIICTVDTMELTLIGGFISLSKQTSSQNLPKLSIVLFEATAPLIVCTVTLVLAGIELIFFMVAHMVLCFGFVTKTVFITHQCFSYC